MAYQAAVVFQKWPGVGYGHVEVCLVPFPDDGYAEKSKLLYTIFMGESFSLNFVTTQRSRAKYSVLAIPITKEEHDDIQAFLMKLTMLPATYNYVDLSMALAPKFMVNTFMPDVEKGTVPTRVFCSQAVLLALKFSLHRERKDALSEILSTVNSRTCTPNRLFQLLKQAGCREGDVETLYQLGHVPLDVR